ncbi:MAG: hypothetical protein LDL33_15780 [Desulfomonile sp.]|nr:hypothetical protein [Desulfomonile sp.]
MSTANDRDPAHVDVLTLAQLAEHFRIPADVLEHCLYDDAPPPFRLNDQGLMVWRLPDVQKYLNRAWD